MRIKLLALIFSLLLMSNSSAGIPQSAATTSSTQAAAMLVQAAKALTGSVAVNDVTLTGTAEWKSNYCRQELIMLQTQESTSLNK